MQGGGLLGKCCEIEGSPNKLWEKWRETEKEKRIGIMEGDRWLIYRVIGPSCSNSHIPGYINHPKLKSAGDVFVVAVNDPFVTKAWGLSLDPEGKSGVSSSSLRFPYPSCYAQNLGFGLEYMMIQTSYMMIRTSYSIIITCF